MRGGVELFHFDENNYVHTKRCRHTACLSGSLLSLGELFRTFIALLWSPVVGSIVLDTAPTVLRVALLLRIMRRAVVTLSHLPI